MTRKGTKMNNRELSKRLKQLKQEVSDVLDIVIQMTEDREIAVKSGFPIKAKVISSFNPRARLDELEEIPKTPAGYTDYWKAAQLLCEKDGGRLPTPEELKQIAEYIYGQDIEEYGWTDTDIPAGKLLEFMEEHNLKNFGTDDPWFYLWSSTELSSYYAGVRGFYTTSTRYSDYYDRDDADRQVLCLGDEF